jgi:snRNA-activating protein complex subunit 1
MDLAPFKLDIDELLDDYAKEHCTSFTDFKRAWMAKKFSYIYEGRPKTNSGVFMQSLFLHCIGHMASQSSLSQRLAGLFCLYCLYECQPYKPHFKIYLSLEESKQLKEFIAEAKQRGIGLVPALVKRMLDKGMFLFGFINLLGDHGAKQVDELNAFQTKRVKFACDKLFANTQIGRYTHTDLGEELELDTIKKLSMDYAKAKELALTEVSQTVDVENAKHILQNDKLLGDRVEEIVKEWDAQKEEFYQNTGVSPGDELAVVDNDEPEEFLYENDSHAELAVIDNDKSGEFYDENDGFDELDQLLLE